MLLIDAVYINVGGGKVLLDYLIEELEKTSAQIVYLFDSRIKEKHPVIKKSNTIFYIEAGLLSRFKFYKANKNTFEKILCLGNIPPMVAQNCEVITYFHNPMYLDVPEDFNFIEKFKYSLKVSIIKFFKNTTSWWVQSDLIKTSFINKFKVSESKVIIKPFYPPFKELVPNVPVRKKHTYLYVSNATPNKNHIRLLEAFCAFYDKYRVGELTVTISKDYPIVLKAINDKITLGYPIINTGFIKRDDLKLLYLQNEYLVFPSLAESFGLGLVESIENGCKVLGADLPYTYAVCEPSLVFDPYNVSLIYNTFIRTIQEDLKPSVSKIENKIDDLINILT
ncbi:glycosyltransferase [Flavobacterium sp. TAB 87]|uniref:glycosyltransferase n=1 Tax=Flavobacterium sp. TAB 87 TaxID=1729581 RepID=UPI00076D8FFE|nr:glycosyltransferase [Flavobacterium sp. TAB 87]KVV13972.1 glycosyltransferase, family [Flavobacterium sp. TAB 87]